MLSINTVQFEVKNWLRGEGWDLRPLKCNRLVKLSEINKGKKRKFEKREKTIYNNVRLLCTGYFGFYIHLYELLHYYAISQGYPMVLLVRSQSLRYQGQVVKRLDFIVPMWTNGGSAWVQNLTWESLSKIWERLGKFVYISQVWELFSERCFKYALFARVTVGLWRIASSFVHEWKCVKFNQEEEMIKRQT